MKLIVAIVQESDSTRLINALGDANFQTTKLATTGGFLKEGNVTLIIGCQDESVSEVLSIMKEYCSERKKITASPEFPMRAKTNLYNMKPVEVGGATVFVLPIESFYRF